ncbi:hypothetical protein A0J61_00955 [Choanephora cucurbitarum]|uniref:Uncharacterized protein n=1 Tax=Choanephora cucurbitarum TaxID=101091 RepID=A0A1C7NU22_9FUNG|nr:hypothetical protein A0J61_00955 [Choanephora cucurbitarum]
MRDHFLALAESFAIWSRSKLDENSVLFPFSDRIDLFSVCVQYRLHITSAWGQDDSEGDLNGEIVEIDTLLSEERLLRIRGDSRFLRAKAVLLEKLGDSDT